VPKGYKLEVLLERSELRRASILEWHKEIGFGVSFLETEVLVQELAENC
jgi:hypothetical protein